MILEGKIAFVTGGSRGIGRGIAIALAGAGAKVAFTFRESIEEAAEVVEVINNAGGEGVSIRMNVTDRKSVREAMAYCVERFSGIDILVNNAGINKPTDFDSIDEEDWDEIMSVNLRGPFLCMQEVFEYLRKSGGGSIINIGSVSGQYGGPRTAHYAASKAGLISLGQVAARFGAKDKIRVNTLAAGLISSEMGESGLRSVSVQSVAKNILMGRLGAIDEVAKVVIFLASESASYITGQTINVNGGLYF